MGSVAKELFHDIWKGDLDEAHRTGSIIHGSQRYMNEHPSELFTERSANEVKGILGWAKAEGLDMPARVIANVSTTGIHLVLNAGRIIAQHAGRLAFDDYFNKALAGDRNKLALMADVFGFGDPTTEAGRQAFASRLASMDKGQAKDFFVKRISDLEGGTYHPRDYPGFGRGPIGRWLAQFRVFRWTMAHNVWNAMTSPNYSAAYRTRVLGRFLTGTAIFSSLDPYIRHAEIKGIKGAVAAAAGFGGANIDSQVAYQATEAALKHPDTSNLLYAMTMLMVNDASMGIAGDMIQGVNLLNPDIFSRAIVSGNIPILAEGDNLAMGAAFGLSAALNGSEHDKKRAYEDFLKDFPLGEGISRAEGLSKPPKPPRKQLVRTTLQKGARAVGLH